MKQKNPKERDVSSIDKFLLGKSARFVIRTNIDKAIYFPRFFLFIPSLFLAAVHKSPEIKADERRQIKLFNFIIGVPRFKLGHAKLLYVP